MKETKITIDTRILHTPGFNENHNWVFTKLGQYLGAYEDRFPSIAKLQKWTGWGKNKVIKVTDELNEMGLILKTVRYRKSGGNSSNEYKINTKLVRYVVETCYDGVTFTGEEEDQNPEPQTSIPAVSQNQTPQHIVSEKLPETPNVLLDGVPKSNTAVSQNQTLILSNNISLNTLLENSEKKINSENQELTPEQEPPTNLKDKIKNAIKSSEHYQSNIRAIKNAIEIQDCSSRIDEEALEDMAETIIQGKKPIESINIRNYLEIGYKKAISNQFTRERNLRNADYRSKKSQPSYFEKAKIDQDNLKATNEMNESTKAKIRDIAEQTRQKVIQNRAALEYQPY
jgi:hypothetical protein